MARCIAVRLTDPAGTTEGGIDRIDLTRTYGHTGRSLDLTHTPICPPLPTPASPSRMSGDSEMSPVTRGIDHVQHRVSAERRGERLGA